MPCRDRLFIQIFNLMSQKKHVPWLTTVIKFEMSGVKYLQFTGMSVLPFTD